MSNHQIIPAGSWLAQKGHVAWLWAEGQRLLRFARASRLNDGFGNLDERGRLSPGAKPHLLTTTRMTHCFAIAHLQGAPGWSDFVDHGVAALHGSLRDAEHGGWFAGQPDQEGGDRKNAYLHAFVALAASSAVVAGSPAAPALLEEAVRALETHFWSEEEGALRESFNRDWSETEAYRGANSNMHGVEAFLALADVLKDGKWLDRALRVAERVIHVHAAAHDHSVVEHFDVNWKPLPDFNRDDPANGMRPFGFTPGHSFEWARLLLNLEAALRDAGKTAPSWLAIDAERLFASACRDAWSVDGAPGLVYTLDFDKQAVVRQRLHWVVAEASAAAAALLRRTGEAKYEIWYRRFWDFTETYLIDRCDGSWFHELTPQNTPGSDIWPGKSDLYHAYQATLLPVRALAPTLATSFGGADLS